MNYKTRQPFPHAAYVEGQRNFTYFDRSLSSGLTDVIIESPGDFLYIDQASTGVVSVELNMRQGGTLAPILLAAGGSIECDFASIKLTASAQLNKTVRIVVGNGARIKGGANVNADSMAVSIVDGGLKRSLANQTFMGAISVAGQAAKYTHVQLWNPVGGTKRIYVTGVNCSSANAQIIGLGSSITALTSSSGAADSGPKLVGGSQPTAQIRYENPALNVYSKLFKYDYVAAGISLHFRLGEPIVLSAGCGVTFFSGTANTELYASFEWFEQ